jgi:hypothetical protein
MWTQFDIDQTASLFHHRPSGDIGNGNDALMTVDIFGFCIGGNSRISSWDMLARSRLPNLEVKRLRTNSQVLTVFFLRVGLMVLQMEIDCLGYAPPVVVVGGEKYHT